MRAVADVLRRAEQVIAERGWCVGSIQDGQGRVCAIGAIHVAAYGQARPRNLSGPGHDECVAAEDALSDYLMGVSIHVWNDARDRTEADVRAAMLGAADRLERGL